MIDKDRATKIKWFCLRTGCSEEESEKFLKIAKWKIDNAIEERKKYYKENKNE